jgi:hypothetical protein
MSEDGAPNMRQREQAQLKQIEHQRRLLAEAAVNWYWRRRDPFGSPGEQDKALGARVEFLLEEEDKLHHAQLLDLEQICTEWIAGDAPPATLAENILNFSYLPGPKR